MLALIGETIALARRHLRSMPYERSSMGGKSRVSEPV